MQNKHIKLTLIVVVIIVTGWFIYTNAGKPGTAKKIVLKPQVLESITVNDSGSLAFLDKKTGELQVFPQTNLKTKQTFRLPELVGQESILLSPDGSKALSIKRNYDTALDSFILVDLTSTSPAKPLDQNWYNPKWVGNNEIYYTILGGKEVTNDIFSYDIAQNKPIKLLDIEGDTEDDYAKFGNYLAIVDSSSDASPVTITVYDLKTKKVAQRFTREFNQQLLSYDDKLVLIGDKITSLMATASGVVTEEYPVPGMSNRYALNSSGDKLIAVPTDKAGGSATVSQLNLSPNNQWQALDINVDLSRLGYIYNLVVKEDTFVLVTSTGVYQY